MTRKPKRRAKRSVKRKPVRRAPARRTSAKSDQLDAFIAVAARVLDLPAQQAWLPAIKANLRVTLQHAAAVTEFELPDDAEPAPVFRA
jgi:hypothetical protein